MITLNIPPELRFTWIDWSVIVLYMAGLIYMSMRLGEGQENQEDYYVGGRDLPWWAVGLSTMATQTSAISFISIPAFVALRKGGGMRWLQYEFAVPLAMIFIMVFLIPFFRKLKLISVYQYLEMRYSSATRYLLAGVFLISRSLGTAAGLFAGAIVLTVCFGLPIWLTILIIGIVTLIYDTIGGMKAVVYSDVIQMGILLAGIFLCCGFALADVGGVRNALALFPKEQLVAFDFGAGSEGHKYSFWPFLIGGFFLYASYYGCDQSQTQREFSAPTTDDTKKSLVFNGYFRFPLTLLYVAMGLFVGAFVVKNSEMMQLLPVVNNEPNIDFMLPVYILYKIPIGFRAIIFAAILAAVMSSLDSSINSLSASTMQDFIQKWINFGDNPKKYLFYSRATTVFWGLTVTGMSFLFMGGSSTIVEKINAIGSAFYGPILAAFIMGVSVRKINSIGIITGILTGVLTNLLIGRIYPDLSWMWWNVIGFFVTAAVSCAASFLGPAQNQDTIQNLIIWNSDHMEEEKKWIPGYAMLILYFFLMLGTVWFLPKLIEAVR